MSQKATVFSRVTRIATPYIITSQQVLLASWPAPADSWKLIQARLERELPWIIIIKPVQRLHNRSHKQK